MWYENTSIASFPGARPAVLEFYTSPSPLENVQEIHYSEFSSPIPAYLSNSFSMDKIYWCRTREPISDSIFQYSFLPGRNQDNLRQILKLLNVSMVLLKSLNACRSPVPLLCHWKVSQSQEPLFRTFTEDTLQWTLMTHSRLHLSLIPRPLQTGLGMRLATLHSSVVSQCKVLPHRHILHNILATSSYLVPMLF